MKPLRSENLLCLYLSYSRVQAPLSLLAVAVFISPRSSSKGYLLVMHVLIFTLWGPWVFFLPETLHVQFISVQLWIDIIISDRWLTIFFTVYWAVLPTHLKEVMFAWLTGSGMLGEQLSGRKKKHLMHWARQIPRCKYFHHGHCQARMIYMSFINHVMIYKGEGRLSWGRVSKPACWSWIFLNVCT